MVTSERLHLKTAVYLIFQNNQNQYLFQRRFNTGWSDGLLTLPSGHVDPGETPLACAVHESQEEVVSPLAPQNLQLVHVQFDRNEYIDFYFMVKQWTGSPAIGEPEKCSELVWGQIDALKDSIVPKVYIALKAFSQNLNYSEISLD
jgi:mutator protein MutT